MENHFQSKFFLVLGIIIIIGGLFYLFNLKNPRNTPYKVLTPENSQAGTVVSLYKDAPSDFPKEIILENRPLHYSGTITTSDGKTQTSVSYVSSRTMQNITDVYALALPNFGWNIIEKAIYAKVSIIRATKGEQSMLLSVSPLGEGGVMVSFQYEK